MNFNKITKNIEYFDFNEENTTFIGKYLGREIIESKKGEKYNPFLFEQYETGEQFYISDASALVLDLIGIDKDGVVKNDGIKEGTICKIVWRGKINLDKGRTYNKFVVYAEKK